MHFHLPTPLHGWREFAGEVGIIVVGVLIALAAEQAVEKIHWNREVAAERQSLLQEASDSLDGIRARATQQPCVDQRLKEIIIVLERHHRGEPLGITGEVARPVRQTATRGTWQIALAGQALAHMSHDDKLAFSDAFGKFDLWDEGTRQEADSWQRLTPLNTADLLTEADWSRIRSAYADAVADNARLRVLAPWMIDQIPMNLSDVRRYRSAGDLSRFRQLKDLICKPILAGSK